MSDFFIKPFVQFLIQLLRLLNLDSWLDTEVLYIRDKEAKNGIKSVDCTTDELNSMITGLVEEFGSKQKCSIHISFIELDNYKIHAGSFNVSNDSDDCNQFSIKNI